MKTFVVLGMHRSATSLVAKGMSSVVHLGDAHNMLEPAKDNPEGFFENKRFLELNQEILFKAGGNWLEPPSEEKILEQKSWAESKIAQLIKEEATGHLLWGWKEPRTTLTIRLYHHILPQPHYIACFRNRDEVARSLSVRGGMSIQKGLRCADIYNARLLQFLIDVQLPKQ